MIVRAWRIVQARHAKNAFDGEGARLYGGRWNPPGVAMVYTAGSKSLAMLELMVHGPLERLLNVYVCIPVEFDGKWMKSIARQELPRDWRLYPAANATRNIGERWVRGGISAILEVPSAVVPDESNYLINPSHPDFARLCIGKPEPLDIDARLLKNAR